MLGDFHTKNEVYLIVLYDLHTKHFLAWRAPSLTQNETNVMKKVHCSTLAYQ